MDSKLLWTGKEASSLDDLQTLNHCQPQWLFRGSVWSGHYDGSEAECQKEAADESRQCLSASLFLLWVFHRDPRSIQSSPHLCLQGPGPRFYSTALNTFHASDTGLLGPSPKEPWVVFSSFVQAAVPPPITVGSKPHPWVWVTSSQGLSGTFPALAQKPFAVVQSLKLCPTLCDPTCLGAKKPKHKTETIL